MGSIFGVASIIFFSYLNYFVWGDNGYIVHLLGYPVQSYSLIWVWIGMIAIICGSNYAVGGGQKHPVWWLVAGWWIANISGIEVLQAISFRGIEEEGSLLFGMPSLMLDFIVLGAIDLAALVVIWLFVIGGMLTASFWTIVFCAFLVANLFGHTSGSYNLMVGVSPDITAQSYDAYMYLSFTAMLVFQAIGSGGDAFLRLGGSNVDLYRDIRPVIRDATHRHIHLS